MELKRQCSEFTGIIQANDNPIHVTDPKTGLAERCARELVTFIETIKSARQGGKDAWQTFSHNARNP